VKPINVTVDYLRAAACEDTFAAAVVTRMGRRIANVRAEAWQRDRAAPVAAAHMNVMLVRD
jgi:acyl-coenzyme A thioesterase PaaI-like protein